MEDWGGFLERVNLSWTLKNRNSHLTQVRQKAHLVKTSRCGKTGYVLRVMIRPEHREWEKRGEGTEEQTGSRGPECQGS